MIGCILHVVGKHFDPALVLQDSALDPYDMFRKGDPRLYDLPGAGVHDVGGFKCEIETDGDDISSQVEAVRGFLEEHFDELLRIRGVREVDSMTVDIGCTYRVGLDDFFSQSAHLSPELIRLCGQLGMGIELSFYPVSPS